MQNDSISMRQKKKKLADVILPQKIIDIVPEAQAYMELLAFEKKLDSVIMKKKSDIQVMIFKYFQKLMISYNLFVL